MRPFLWLFSGLKWLGIAIVVMIAIFVSYVVYMAGKVSYPAPAKTTDTEIVHIKLDGKVPLYIPKAYLSWRRTWKGGDQEMVEIGAMLPDMKPVSLVPEIIEEDRLYINLDGGYENRTVFYTQDAERRYAQLKPYLEDTGHGLSYLNNSYYNAEAKGEVSGHVFFKNYDYYLAHFADGRRAKIRCGKTAPRCTVHLSFNSEVSGSYVVDRKYIPERWNEMNDKVVALVRSFRQPPEQKQE